MAFEENVPLPKINKIPFIVFDVVLLLFAAVIVFRSDWPLTPLMFMGTLFLVAMGGVVACLPFFIEFRTTAKLKEYDLSQANDDNARRIEQALYGIQEIGESVVQATDRNAEIAGAFETLLERMESRIKEIKGGSGTAAGIDPEELKTALREQLDSVREEFAQAIAEQAAMTGDKQHDKLNSALSKLQGLPMQVTLLGDLAVRYQTLVALMQDTAASMVSATPVKDSASVGETDLPEDSFDGVLEAEVEENVAPETAAIIEHEMADDEEEADEEEAAEEPVDGAEPDAAEDVAEEYDEELPEEDDFIITTSLPEEDEDAAADEEGAEPDIVVEDTAEDEEVAEAETESTEVDGEDFSQMDARFEEELSELDEELSNDEPDDDTEPEFLTDEDLADEEEEAVGEEPEEEAVAQAEAEPVADDGALAMLNEDEEFDIALSDDGEIVAEEEAPAAPEEAAVDEGEAAAVADDDASGMGFDDWDDFGEIATTEEDEDEPEQGELIDDVPATPKSKPKKKKGATTLIAQVLIGIGNKPYVRGTGPGLSEDEGVPMEFLEIGKWQWTAPESDEPVTVRIYKNDEDPAEGDPIEIPAGQRRSVAPKFSK
ncbi:hypothetical protein [Cerasicoccus fimbriatus]|uniref:hypothetical protein n=1 Tax=Cerasicoccus fimbriatus TaxID=3014554 RepID=UPI0022B30EC1|nr:hypothetical protein [Cerasicoccus sp. TK19100]